MFLLKFWLQRFAAVSLIAMVALALVEWAQQRVEADYLSVLVWAALAATVSASLATWWAYRRGCAVR